MRWCVVALMGLMACGEEPVVAFSCDYAYEFAEGIDDGVYEEGTLDCETFGSSGDQLLITLEMQCEDQGDAREALSSECVCDYGGGRKDCEEVLAD